MKKGFFIGFLLALALLCVGCANKTEQTDAQKIVSTSTFTSPKTYYVKVNLQTNVVTVYKKDSKGHFTVPYKAMLCSDGKETPTGSYDISWTGRWRWMGLVGGVCGQYCTQITGDYLFHSVPYTRWYDHGSLQKGEYDKLGTTCSHGCIRLTVADARWIYNHKNDIAMVTLYKSSTDSTLTKPVTQKISGKKYQGWDPTDPDENNPWRNAKVKVGTYTGLKKDSAVIALKKAGLRAKIVYKYSNKTKGNVIAQSAKSGAYVKWSSTITLTVSKGPAPVTVESYIGLNRYDATAAAEKAGLTVKRVYKYSTKTKYSVIAQSIASGKVVKKGTTITFTISKGRAPVTVGSYVGMKKDDAVAAAKNTGLVVKLAYQYSAKTMGNVIAQSLACGESVTGGSTITLTVSKGPATVGSYVDMTEAEAVAAIQSLGLQVDVNYVDGELDGIVVNQDIEAGTSVAAGSKVVLTVSRITEPVGDTDTI